MNIEKIEVLKTKSKITLSGDDAAKLLLACVLAGASANVLREYMEMTGEDFCKVIDAKDEFVKILVNLRFELQTEHRLIVNQSKSFS